MSVGRDIIVIRASVGGVEALWTLMHALPAHFPASGFVVLHIPAHKPRLQLERFQEFKFLNCIPIDLMQAGATLESTQIVDGAMTHD